LLFEEQKRDTKQSRSEKVWQCQLASLKTDYMPGAVHEKSPVISITHEETMAQRGHGHSLQVGRPKLTLRHA
jgi:hypothetical protein